MKLELLKSPYPDKEECMKVQVNLGQSEWKKLYAGLPFHGFQDAFLAILFDKFMQLTKDKLPKNYDLDSEEIIADLLGRLTLAPVDGYRNRPTFSGGLAEADQEYPREEDKLAETAE